MKAFLQSVIDKLNGYLSDGTGIASSMRLYSFIIITTGCICMLTFTGYVCNNILKVDLNSAAIFVGAIAAFIATGLTGKWLQAKVENKSTIVNAVATKIDNTSIIDDSSTAANITATGNM